MTRLLLVASCLCLTLTSTACGSLRSKPDVISAPIAEITKPRPQVCPGVPAFEPAHGLNSEQLELAQYQYALELRKRLRCHIELGK